tara:strand:- start:4741 stop:5646 length:906 start_codon:yes stop_codon:yes gene_type:complete
MSRRRRNAARRHNCRNDMCNIIRRLTRPCQSRPSLNQICNGGGDDDDDDDVCSLSHPIFETRTADTCNECSFWCPCCGASKFTKPDLCAYNHLTHTFNTARGDFGIFDPLLGSMCDQCRKVDRRCEGYRTICRCNTSTQHHHCPTHANIPDYRVEFVGSNRQCESCRIARNISNKSTVLEDRTSTLASQNRNTLGARQRVMPVLQAGDVEKIEWHNARRHLQEVVNVLQSQYQANLPLTNVDMKLLYRKKSSFIGNNNKFGLDAQEVVKRMFQWMLDTESVITSTTTLKALPWEDPCKYEP